jgi:calcineurin-like phosphoesterase family protein
MRYWTSDFHLGHHNMTKAGKDLCGRPFGDADHMNHVLIRNWNERVMPDDHVCFLGDICMGKIDRTLPLIKALNGDKFLWPGNHDRVHPYFGKSPEKMERWVDEYEAVGLNIMPLMTKSTLGPYRIAICHFPMSPDLHHEVKDNRDKFAQWRPVDDGTWDYLIHGHVHTDWKIHSDGRQINVSCDVWDYAPITDEDLLQLIDEKGTA